jgi:hypothetical protein
MALGEELQFQNRGQYQNEDFDIRGDANPHPLRVLNSTV